MRSPACPPPMSGPEMARRGRTSTGTTFDVPRTPDMIETLLAPQRWGAAEVLSFLILLLSAFGIIVRTKIPLFIYITIFLFWRLSYNAFLGLILHLQGTRAILTHTVATANPSTRALLNWLATRALPSPHDWSRSPPALNAWLCFRALALVILTADGASYIALAFKCSSLATSASLPALAASMVGGIALCVFSVWAKLEAHHALGDYAWYWGDFFFISRTDLVLTGVFRLAPHPMYTLGYSAYYGAALLARSHALLLVSLLAHAAQMAFLYIVEEPHMDRIYASPRDEITPAPAPGVSSLLYSPHLAPVAVIVTLASLLLFARPAVPVIAVLVILWRVLHFGVLGGVLVRQSKDKEWTKRFAVAGMNSREAFEVWRGLYMLSYAINHILFFALALQVRAPSDSTLVRDAAHAATAVAMLALAGVAARSAYGVIGAFGFAYGDFFLPAAGRELRYDGTFRYLGHPSCALDYLAYYAVAVWKRSWGIAVLAALVQICHAVFVHAVEIPHMKSTYSGMREQCEAASRVTELVNVVFDKVPFVESGVARARALWIRVRDGVARSAVEKCKAVYQRVICGVKDKFGALHENICGGVVNRSGMATERVNKIVSGVNSEKMVHWLRMVGARIEPIAEGKDVRHALKQE